MKPTDYPEIQDLRKAIPPGCSLPCLQTSLYYISRDIVASVVLVYFAFNYIREDQLGQTLSFIAWGAYSFLQGLICTGIWVLAHECGHGSLFVSTKLNDGNGFVLHSFLMVPYFSWKSTHRRHHRFTGHATRDVAFVPAMKPVDSDRDIFSPSGTAAIRLASNAFFNLSAGKDSLLRDVSVTERWLRVSLFDPWSSVFRDKKAWSVLASDCGLGIMGCFLGWCGQEFGSETMVLLYLLPYLWVNNWLGVRTSQILQQVEAFGAISVNIKAVAITYLQHNHPQVPHYTDEGWNFTKGALSAIDRDFGFVGRHFFHLIIDRHVVHHLFPHNCYQATIGGLKPLRRQEFSGSAMVSVLHTEVYRKRPQSSRLYPMDVGSGKFGVGIW
ncbi:fatty acid desaturase [Colletotrichum lupini]|uniref:Fatty acid desaturase n=1 Tax=Colletotrichum lupini TaxID=145971 RepID=A0A9Q8TBC1_9PEZI|nr:fatty acid desaturase [Colletotrichum lupini]UQC91526.1 fatty acid desaturase [Colletotrichum lupini]